MPRAWSLMSRPNGMPMSGDFGLIDLPAAPLADGEIRIANRWLSVDPYMRGRMNDVKSYAPPFVLGEPMQGGAVGEVIESRADGVGVGDMVQHMAGWRDEAVVPAGQVQKLPALGVPPQAFLGQLGMPGMTAYFGLLHGRRGEAGRHGVRLRRGRRGRLHRHPDRQGEGDDGDRFGRRRRQMRVVPVARRRCDDRLQGRRVADEEAAGGGAAGDRRLFRQCRRRASRCRARRGQPPCALRDLRDDRRL